VNRNIIILLEDNATALIDSTRRLGNSALVTGSPFGAMRRG
jgi:hypothetical protein